VMSATRRFSRFRTGENEQAFFLSLSLSLSLSFSLHIYIYVCVCVYRFLPQAYVYLWQRKLNSEITIDILISHCHEIHSDLPFNDCADTHRGSLIQFHNNRNHRSTISNLRFVSHTCVHWFPEDRRRYEGWRITEIKRPDIEAKTIKIALFVLEQDNNFFVIFR